MLKATNQDGTAYSNITITANLPPHSATLQVSPPSGVAISTLFALSVVDPVDSTTNFPFMYQFGLLDASHGLTWLTGPQTSRTLSVILPGGIPLTLVARVIDKIGSFVDVNTSCIVTSQPLTATSILSSQLSNITSSYNATKYWRTMLADIIVLLLQANSTAIVLPSSFKNSVLGQVSAILSGPLPQTSADYSVVASVLSLVTTSPGAYDLVTAMNIAKQLTSWFGLQAAFNTYNLLPLLPDGSQPSVLLSNTSGALNPNGTSVLATQTAQNLLDSMNQIASTTSEKSAATLFTGGVASIGKALCNQIVTGENPVTLSTQISQLYVSKGMPLGPFNVANMIVDFGSSLAAAYNASACGSPYIACDEACIQGVAYTRDLFANTSSTVLQLSPTAVQMINTSIAGINTQKIAVFSNIFSITISIPNQNTYMNVSGLPSPFQVYIPAQQLPSPQSQPLCFYRSLVNGSSAPNDTSFLWKLDSTSPPLNATIRGKQYFVCSFTHLTEFVIGSLPPPVIVTQLPAVVTTTVVKIVSSSTAIPLKTRKVPTIYPTTAPHTTIAVTQEADVVAPAVGSVIPIIFIATAIIGVAVIVYVVWRKKYRGSIKITPVEPKNAQPEPVRKPSMLLLTPEQAKVPMEVIKLTESGERQTVGALNILPSIRLRELRQQITEDLEDFKGKPFYLLTKQLCDIEPAAEQQMFVSLVYGTKYIFVREVSDTDEYARQFCICGKAAQFLCTGCTSQGYCSEECQNVHWASHHQKECTVLSEKRRRNEILHQHRPVSIAGLASSVTTPTGVKTTTTDWKKFLKASRPPSQVAIKISPERNEVSSADNSALQPGSLNTVTSPPSQRIDMPEASSPVTIPSSSQGAASPKVTSPPLQMTSLEIGSPGPQEFSSASPQGTGAHQVTLHEPISPQREVTSPVVVVDHQPRPSVLSPLPQSLTTMGLMAPAKRLGVVGTMQFVEPLAKPPSFVARARLPVPPLMSPATTPGSNHPFLMQTSLPRPVLLSPVSTGPVPNLSPSPNGPQQPLSPVPHLPAPRIQPLGLLNKSPGLPAMLQTQPFSPLPLVRPAVRMPPHQTLFEPANPQQQRHPSVFSGESRLMVQSVVPDDLAMTMSLNASMFKKARDEPLIETGEEEETTSEEEESSEVKLNDSEDTGSSGSSDEVEEEEPPATAPPPLQLKKKPNLQGDKSVN